MKQIDIKDLNGEDLQENLAEQVDLLTKLKMSHAVSPLENPSQIRTVRRAVARLKTEIRKRELATAQNK